MFSRQLIIVVALSSILLPHISAQDDPETLDPDLSSDRESRQFSFITTPFRRAASTTREIVRFIRDYSSGRFENGTNPNGTEPQTYLGKRTAQLIQSGTLSNIRAAVNYILQSEAVPVVTGIIKNIDRDTLQLLSPNAGASILARRNATSTTPPPPKSRNRTRTRTRRPSNSTLGRNSTTIKPTVLVGSTTTGKSGIRSTINSGNVANKVVIVNNEDDEAESFEEDDD